MRSKIRHARLPSSRCQSKGPPYAAFYRLPLRVQPVKDFEILLITVPAAIDVELRVRAVLANRDVQGKSTLARPGTQPVMVAWRDRGESTRLRGGPLQEASPEASGNLVSLRPILLHLTKFATLLA